jgi:ABC-type sugar transport system ATPase subunit
MKKFVKGGVVDTKSEQKKAIELCQKIQLKASDISAPPSSLSGGNQQKVVFAKLLNCDLKVLILDEPTKGIDVGAKYEIYKLIHELADQGKAVVLVSSELPELLGMADRIYTIFEGSITGELAKEEASQEALMKRMTITSVS